MDSVVAEQRAHRLSLGRQSNYARALARRQYPDWQFSRFL